MATKTRRLEMRAAPDEVERISAAASALGESVSTFITQAALRHADQVIARHDVTVIPEALFTSLIDSLDTPDAAPRLTAAYTRRAHRRTSDQ